MRGVFFVKQYNTHLSNKSLLTSMPGGFTHLGEHIICTGMIEPFGLILGNY
jgi:hypothetical protein